MNTLKNNLSNFLKNLDITESLKKGLLTILLSASIASCGPKYEIKNMKVEKNNFGYVIDVKYIEDGKVIAKKITYPLHMISRASESDFGSKTGYSHIVTNLSSIYEELPSEIADRVIQEVNKNYIDLNVLKDVYTIKK